MSGREPIRIAITAHAASKPAEGAAPSPTLHTAPAIGVRSASDPSHLVRVQGVAGSNPVSPTNNK